MPTQGRYRELTSTSNCTTFQARRLRIRMRDGEGVRPLATLNGTLRDHPVDRGDPGEPPAGRRLGRGCPQALRPFLGGREVLEPVAP